MEQVKSFFGSRVVKRVLWQSGAYILATLCSVAAVQVQAWQPSNGVEFVAVLGAVAVVLQNISKELNTYITSLNTADEEGAGGGIS